MLGAIESLLSAVVADGMAGTKHDPDAELLALGVGNVACPFFGGIAATGAIARTATGIRYGSKSPISTVVHAVVVLAAVLALAPLISYLPMASLAALLLLVAWNMSEAKHFVHMVRVAPKSDVAVLLTCYFLTVVFDMVVAVTAGAQGAAACENGRAYRVRAVDSTEIDRLGRGDAFVAGFLHGMETGGAERGLRYGAALAALKQTYRGDIAWTTAEELEAVVNSNEPQIDR